jgi:hypothetical protein
MESIATGAFRDFEHLQEEVRRIQPPRPQWSEFLGGQGFSLAGKPAAGDGSADCRDLENRVKAVGERGGELIPLDDRPGVSPRAVVQFWHSLWKRHMGDIPRVIFMGGNGDKVFLAFFRQPLTWEDFGRLWSA